MLIKTLSTQTVSISEQKCSSLTDEAADDCWHGLAHLESNASRYQNINNSEKKRALFRAYIIKSSSKLVSYKHLKRLFSISY